MRTISSPAVMQRLALKQKRAGVPVGLVPTMGYLHAGHRSLVEEARRRVGASGWVVLSLYVNPTQFAPTEDLSKYPRDLKRDLAMCREAGVDAVFMPSDAVMYPGREEGRYSTYVVEESLTRPMEGASRPTHFRGVTTVVAKLFNIVLPDVAIFGAKDWQQAAVISRMNRDMNFPVRIVVAPTVREPDGLAMSSRNKYLDPTQRLQATVLWESLKSARAEVKRNGTVDAAALHARLSAIISARSEARLDYLEFFDPETLQPVVEVTKGVQMALAVFVGKTRLIDNGRL